MEVSPVEMYKSLEPIMGKETAERLISFVENGKASKEFVKESIDATKDVFLTKDDKIDLITLMKQDKIDLISLMKQDKIELITRINEISTRLDSHFKWLVGIMLFAISLATILGKLL